MGDGLLYLSRGDVSAACEAINPPDVVGRALASHAHGESFVAAEAHLSWTPPNGGAARSLNMPGYVGGVVPAVGTKVINANTSNPNIGLPRADGVMMLFDPQTAVIRCIMDGSHISALRTASVTALCVDLLARDGASEVALVGCGALARAHLQLVPGRLRSPVVVRLHDAVPARAAELAALVRGWGSEVRVFDSAEEAVRGADVIIPVTTTTSPYISLESLAPGSLVVNVSLDDVAPDVVLGADVLVVDDWRLIIDDDRRLLGRMYREGLVDMVGHGGPPRTGVRTVDATIGELVTGLKRGRARETDVILVNPFGMAIEDVAVADAVYRWALDAGAGLWLER